jgi:hypothetical protein
MKTAPLTDRDSRVQKYLSDQAAAKANMATYPESIRARLLAWQEDQREFFMDTILEIVAEFIAFENRRPDPATDAVEAVARAMAKSDGLDWDEVCGLESDDLGDCNSGTCIAAYHEDHDTDWAREFYLRHARAALTVMPGQGERDAIVE